MRVVRVLVGFGPWWTVRRPTDPGLIRASGPWEGASAPDTVLWFAVIVGLGVTAAGWALLGRRPRKA